MGEIERASRSTSRRPGAVSRAGSGPGVGDAPPRWDAPLPGFAGEAIDYVSNAYGIEDSWDLLPVHMRDWAEDAAGDRIRDPRSGADTIYWYCAITPDRGRGPRRRSRSAVYDLLVFGKRGLVAAAGTTDGFSEKPGATKWRHTRYALGVDPGAIRHDHCRAPSHAAGAGGPGDRPPGGTLGDDRPLGTGRGPGNGRGPGSDRGPGSGDRGPGSGPGPSAGPGGPALLPAPVAGLMGNLPLRTQRFLCAPFVDRSTPLTQCAVYAATEERGREYRETYWAYLFDKGHLAFGHAYRSVPLTSGLSAERLWNGSPEARALLTAPWDVVAWTSPVAPRPPGGG